MKRGPFNGHTTAVVWIGGLIIAAAAVSWFNRVDGEALRSPVTASKVEALEKDVASVKVSIEAVQRTTSDTRLEIEKMNGLLRELARDMRDARRASSRSGQN